MEHADSRASSRPVMGQRAIGLPGHLEYRTRISQRQKAILGLPPCPELALQEASRSPN